MSFKPITVSQLNGYIKQIFDAEELLHGISVYGEISGWSVVRGTAYFTLKDEASALSCVCFDLKETSFKDGDSVMVIGSAKYYAKGGKLNFNVVKIEPYGESILYKKFLELKEKLEQKGYFDESTKKTIPKDIRRIGVVTSAEGAVIQDIINVRTRRNPGIDIVLYPVKVQGINAENEIASGIEFFDNYNVDVIVVARGGGSLEDLMPFNTEIVAEAVHNCNKFIMSAVGHETDFTICDFCSDMRAPTPSAAAELICNDFFSLKQSFRSYVMRFIGAISRYTDGYATYIQTGTQNLMRVFDVKFLQITEKAKNNINLLKTNSKYFLEENEHSLNLNFKLLQKLNPNEVLKLGYSAIRKNNKYIGSIKDIAVNDNIEVKLFDGKFNAKVTNLEGVWILKMQWKN